MFLTKPERFLDAEIIKRVERIALVHGAENAVKARTYAIGDIHGMKDYLLNLLEFIRSNYAGEIIENSTHIIHPCELDIFLPELKIAFEYNGLYWHSDIYKENDYHLNKRKKCEKLGIELFHIWEDDWIFKENQIKLLILNKLGKIKIFYGFMVIKYY